MNLWASLQAEWAALGEVGQYMALSLFSVGYAFLCIAGIWWATRHPLAGPEEMTDASHSPTRGVDAEYSEARFWAEKEQAG